MIATGRGKITELKLLSNNKEQEQKGRRGKRRGKVMLLLSVAFVSYMAFSVFNQFTRVDNMQSSMKTLQYQVAELQNRNEALRVEIKQIKSDSYIEQAAREQLGLVKPGETLVVPAQPEQGRTAVEQGNAAFNVKYKNIYD